VAEKQPKDRYDLVVVGGGPAGLAAAIYAARQGLSTAIIAGELGGQTQWASQVENYLGFELIAGSELAGRFRAHAGKFDIDTFEGRCADALVPAEEGFVVHSREGLQLQGRAVIIASGRAPVRLAVPGERELVGRGVSYCATCDAAFFRGRPVAVLGPGESAADAALQLAALDAKVVLISEQPLRAPQTLLARLAGTDVEVRTGLHATRIEGHDHVTALVVKDDAEQELVLPVDAVFIEAGSIAAEEFTGGLVRVNASGEVEVDRELMTSRPGVFAAGDVTDALGKQIIIAAGDGARAGVAAARWLQRQPPADPTPQQDRR
jgi:thioredoxin reductase